MGIAKYIKTIVTMLMLTTLWMNSHAQENERQALIDSLRSVMDTMPESESKLKLLNQFAYYQIQVDSLRKYSRMTIDMARRLKNGEFEANGYRFLGWSYVSTGNNDSSLIYYLKAANAFDSIGHYGGVGITYIGLSELEEVQKHTNEAIDYTMAVIKLGEEWSNRNLRSLGYYRLAVLYNRLGATDEAMKYNEKSYQLNQELGFDMEIGNNFRIKASSLINYQNDTTSLLKAKDYLYQALNFYEKAEDIFDIVGTRRYMAEAYIKLSKQIDSLHDTYLDSALINIKQSKKLCDLMDMHYYEMLLDMSLISYYVEKGDLTNAQLKLDSISKINIEKMELEDDRLNTTLIVLKAQEKWKEALDVMEQIDKRRKLIMINEYDIKLTEKTSSQEYITKLKQLEKQKEEQQKQNEIDREFHEITNNIILAILVLAILAIIVVTLQYIIKRRTNIKLKQQKNDIQIKNEELNTLNLEIQKQHKQIEEQTEEITHQTKVMFESSIRMFNDLEAAEMIQRALMPSHDKIDSAFGKVLIYWKPFNVVSGDFYWGAEILGHKFLAVADCTGHGVPGALMSTLGISTLNNITSTMQKNLRVLTAAETLDLLRNKIINAINRPATDYENSVNDGMDIALLIFSPDMTQVQFAGAKRPLWLARNGEITIHKGDTITVGPGTIGSENRFTNNIINIRPNDTLYIFSDGITDQLSCLRDGKRKKYQSMQLKRILESTCNDDFDSQWFNIDTSLQQWMGDTEPQTDDMLLMGIRIG